MNIMAMLLALIAFSAFGVATHGHYQRLTGQRLPGSYKAWWQSAGWLMLTLSATASIIAKGWAFGCVWWFGYTMLAASAAFIALNLAPLTLRK